MKEVKTIQEKFSARRQKRNQQVEERQQQPLQQTKRIWSNDQIPKDKVMEKVFGIVRSDAENPELPTIFLPTREGTGGSWLADILGDRGTLNIWAATMGQIMDEYARRAQEGSLNDYAFKNLYELFESCSSNATSLKGEARKEALLKGEDLLLECVRLAEKGEWQLNRFTDTDPETGEVVSSGYDFTFPQSSGENNENLRNRLLEKYKGKSTAKGEENEMAIEEKVKRRKLIKQLKEQGLASEEEAAEMSTQAIEDLFK